MRKLDVQSYAYDLAQSATSDLAKFQTNMVSNPAYAFEWSTAAMEAAVKQDVAQYIINAFERAKERGIPEASIGAAIIQHATAETFRMASRASQSTSVTANAMDRYRLAVWAELAQKAFENARFSNSADTHVVMFQSVPAPKE